MLTGAGVWLPHVTFGAVACLLSVLVLSSCVDEIKTAEEQPPPSGPAQSIQAEHPYTADRQRLFALVSEVSLSARALYAALGRESETASPAAGTNEILLTRRPGLPLLRNDLQRALRELEEFIAERTAPHMEAVGYELQELRAASTHIVSTIDKFIDSGRLDRVHSLYVDRVDRQLFAVIQLLIGPDHLTSLSLTQLMTSFLEHLKGVNRDACAELQCSLYGIDPPISQTARIQLLLPASRIIAFEPAMRHWLRIWSAQDNTTELLRDILLAPWTASQLWGAEMFDLVNGADEARRSRHLTAHDPAWPFSAQSLSERLLSRYAELLKESLSTPTD